MTADGVLGRVAASVGGDRLRGTRLAGFRHLPRWRVRQKGMAYSLAVDGDGREKQAASLFLPASFPAYEAFWIKHVVPLTNRPHDVHFKDAAALHAAGKTDEDLAIAQLHYTTLKHLLAAHAFLQVSPLDDVGLGIALSELVGAQDTAFEVLQRYGRRGRYDPWTEKRLRGGPQGGQDAQASWKRANGYPLQGIRDYRNKLLHGRTPPGIIDKMGLKLPSIAKVDVYCDWRKVTLPGNAAKIPAGDFEYCSQILAAAWRDTLNYFEQQWNANLLP